MQFKGWSILFLASVGGSAHAMSIAGLYCTGVDNNGNPLGQTATDQHYSLVNSPINGAVRTPLDGIFPLNGPYWLSNQADSHWIAPNGTLNDTAPAGTYIYRTTFTLSGTSGGSNAFAGDPIVDYLKGYRVRLWGKWTSDDVGVGVFLNGAYIGGSNEAEKPWATWANFDTGYVNHGFLEGANTLEFRVQNAVFAGRNPTGIQAQVHAAFEAVPEPASLAGLAVGAFAMLRKRKAKR